MLKRDAIKEAMCWVQDMLEINGVDDHRPQGYGVEVFEIDGWEMTITVTGRRATVRKEIDR